MAILKVTASATALPELRRKIKSVIFSWKNVRLYGVSPIRSGVRGSVALPGGSSIHSLPTEPYNQDVVSLGMHAAVTAMDAMDCLRSEISMVLLAATQAVDLRGDPDKLGGGLRSVYGIVRELAAFQDRDRPMEREVAALAATISSRSLC